MSETVAKAVREMNARLDPQMLGGTVKFVITGEGAIVIDAAGARAKEGTADVTLSANEATFRAIIAGKMDPARAFMTGKLSVDGDMSIAMQLGRALG